MDINYNSILHYILLILVDEMKKEVHFILMIWVIYLCTKMSSATLFCIDLYIQTRTFMHICQIILLLWIEEMMSEQNIQNINQMIRIYWRKFYAIWNVFMKLSYTVPSHFMKYLVKNLWTPAVICCVQNITISILHIHQILKFEWDHFKGQLFILNISFT